jgi:galactose mutarotase-like enzyme
VLSTVRANAGTSPSRRAPGSYRHRSPAPQTALGGGAVAGPGAVGYEAVVDDPPPPTGRQIEITRAGLHATIVELGAALRAYTVSSNGRSSSRPRIDGYERDEMCDGSRGQVLMPWPNRIASGRYDFGGTTHQLALNEPAKGNAIHGLVRYANWTVASVGAEHVTMTYTLYPQPGYPFLLGLEVGYSLGDDGLEVRATATNLGAEACPYGAGFHPYLTLDPARIDTLELCSPAGTYYRSDDSLIPIGREPVAGTPFDFRTPRPIGATRMDTAFTDLDRDGAGRATVRLRDPASGETVELWCDASFAYLMVFTGDTLPDPHRRRRGLAVEPMTCAPDAFRSGDGLSVLEPGASASGTWGIRAASA